ncbi:peptide transport system ATP-binding protein sapF [Klebsiella pneumoniae]|nr:peptide transport system ATP-binding protein sapF [Klebsiella pneumoniae]
MVETLLEVRQLSKTFRYRTGWFHRQTVEAVKPLSFTLRERQTLAIIGEKRLREVDPREDAGGHGGTHQRRIAD